MENQIISVGIIEDQLLFREGMKAILHSGSKNVTGLVIYAVKNDIVKVF